jgi:hypothetical protein
MLFISMGPRLEAGVSMQWTAICDEISLYSIEFQHALAIFMEQKKLDRRGDKRRDEPSRVFEFW